MSSYTRKNGTKVQAYKRAPAGTGQARSRSPRVGQHQSPRSEPASGGAPFPDYSRSEAVAHGHARPRLPRTNCAELRSANAVRKELPVPGDRPDIRPCPGYVIDHVTPLKRGGADALEHAVADHDCRESERTGSSKAYRTPVVLHCRRAGKGTSSNLRHP